MEWCYGLSFIGYFFVPVATETIDRDRTVTSTSREKGKNLTLGFAGIMDYILHMDFPFFGIWFF